jgi:hypothetical protein
LKSLAVRQQAEVWKHSLRQSPLDIDSKSGNQSQPKSLKRLLLCHNNLKDVGVSIIFDLLNEQPGLVGLDLQFNNLSQESGKMSISLLKNNRELCILDIRNNTVGKVYGLIVDDQTVFKLSQYLSVNDKLRMVLNPIPDDDLKWLEGSDDRHVHARSIPGDLIKSKISASKSKIDTGLSELKARARAASVKLKPTIKPKSRQKQPSQHGKLIKTQPKTMEPRRPPSQRDKLINTQPNKAKPAILSPRKTQILIPVNTKSREDPRDIDIVLKALHKYHNKTAKEGLSPHILNSPNGIHQSLKSSKLDKDEISNKQLQSRVEALEALVEKLISSQNPSRSNGLNYSSLDPQGGDPQSHKSSLDPQDCRSQTEGYQSKESPLHKIEMVKLKGISKLSSTNLDEMIKDLEATLLGFHKVLDRLEEDLVIAS